MLVIVQYLVIARKGEKKSAAIKPPLNAVEDIQAEECKQWAMSEQENSLQGKLVFVMKHLFVLILLFF